MTERIPPVALFPLAPSEPLRSTTIDALVRGARLFDVGAFFAAHEAWEKPWLDETDETVRRLLQGLIQIAAAFHKLFETGSVEPAQRLLAKGLAKLDACPASLLGVDVAAFRDAAREWVSLLAAGRIDRAAIPKMRMTSDAP